nr:MFS transporter [Kitasatospora sp. GP30]
MTATAAAAPLRRTLGALLVVELFSGFQQSYFTPLFDTVGHRFHVGVAALAWTVTGPALGGAVATPLLTALGDRHGHLRVLRWTVAVVAASAALIAAAPGYRLLLAGRVLQGVLAGLLPLMFGLVRTRHTVEETRRAIAYLSGGLLLGVLAGSTTATLLLQVGSVTAALWIPAAGTLVGLGLLRSLGPGAAPAESARTAGLDWRGAALLAGGLVATLLAVHEGGAWGWAAPPTLACALIGAGLLAAWVVAARRSAAPLIEVGRLFRPRLLPVFAVACCVHFVVIGGQVPFSSYLTRPEGLGLPAASAGPVLLPAFCGMAVFSVLSSRLGRAIGYGRVTLLGAALLAAGSAGLLLRHGSAVDFAVLLGCSGSGMGLIAGAGRILVVDSVRAEETAAAEGLFELLVGLGAAVGSAVFAAALAAHGGGHRGYQAVWTTGTAVALLGLGAAALLVRRPTPVD